MNVTGAVIVITGAGGGIGAALARAFAQSDPAHMLLLDLELAGLESVARELGGTDITFDRCDVSWAEEIREKVERLVVQRGRVDLFCSNAGVFLSGDVDAPTKDWQLSMGVNLMAHVYAADACLPHMLRQGRGYFLNTVSAAGLLAQIGSAPYTVSKHAALGFAEWLAITYGERGIGVTALCPQGVNTKMLDDLENVNSVASDGIVSAEDVASCALKALESEQFLALPHPGVAEYFRRKAENHDRWIRGMQRFQASLGQTR